MIGSSENSLTDHFALYSILPKAGEYYYTNSHEVILLTYKQNIRYTWEIFLI